jgi:superoxide reductase
MKIFICQVCGHLEFNDLPEKCPACGAEKKDFIQNDNIFKESKEKSPEADIKHVPFLSAGMKCGLIAEEGCVDIIIKIGKTLHPMEQKHYIKFIDCYLNYEFAERILLTPYAINPAGCIHLKEDSGTVTVVENCNIHGYWKADVTL